MKKNNKKLPSVRYSATPPPGWPSEEEFRRIEKELESELPTIIRGESATPVQKAKHEICRQFVRYVRHEGITQRELAKILGVTESRVSEILHYHFDHYTIDRLLELLIKIKPKASLKVG